MGWYPKNVVVVPVDFSEDSRNAIDVGLSAVDEPRHLHAIHVVPTETARDLRLPLRENALKVLADYLADAKYTDIQKNVAHGDPGLEIVRFAEGVHAEVIVIPSHGRTGLARLLMGSVAERVVRMAHCPVLVLRK